MPTSTQTYARLVQSPETFATTLLTICGDRFGDEFLYWDPEVLRMEVDQEFQAKLSEANFNKLMAAVRLVNENTFYKVLPDFIDICNVLFSGVLPQEFDPADAEEIAWGVTEALLIWPPDRNDPAPFAPDIVGYIGEIVKREGIMVPPDVLRLGQIGNDIWNQVQGNYSDDPRMFAAIYDVEKEKTEEINHMVKVRLRALLEQLESLPLESDHSEDMVKQLLAGLQEAKTESEELKPITL